MEARASDATSLVIFLFSVGQALRWRGGDAYGWRRYAASAAEREMSVDTISAHDMAARIGTTSVSDSVTVTQAMIDRFADATGDHQFLPVDPARAAQLAVDPAAA